MTCAGVEGVAHDGAAVGRGEHQPPQNPADRVFLNTARPVCTNTIDQQGGFTLAGQSTGTATGGTD